MIATGDYSNRTEIRFNAGNENNQPGLNHSFIRY